MAERARGVVADDALHDHALAVRGDGHGHRLSAAVRGDGHEQPGARRVGNPRDVTVDRHLVTVAAHARRRRAVKAGRGLGRPVGRELAGRPRGHVGGTQLAGGDRLERRVTGGVEDRGGRQQPQDRDRGQHPAALLGHQHRIEAAQAGAAALLRDQHAGPAGLDGHRPQVGQRGGVLERSARGLDGLDARQRPAGGLAQQHLLVGEGEVHDVTACFSIARSSLKGTPLSSLGSGGSPSTRSPIVLRSTCSVPPADFSPGRKEMR